MAHNSARSLRSLRWLLAALAVGAGGTLLASHHILVEIAGARGAYPLGTVLLFVAACAVILIWPTDPGALPVGRPRYVWALLTSAAGVVVLYGVTTELLQRVFAGTIDSRRGDMLMIMDHAIRRLLEGGNPYTVHRVPWDAPLTYGPLLWAPHIISYLLGFDFRIYTLVAQLVIPGLCFVSAGIRAAHGDFGRGVALFLLGAGIALHPGLRSFHEVGHLQVYWPFLAVLCLLLRQQRWTAASICLGLLASARTPLLSLAPVFFLYLHVKNALTIRRAATFGTALILPFVPFLIVDAAAVKNGMFDTYVRVMKTYVWQSTPWAVDTYGITGRLLERGNGQFVELTQIVCLGLTYVCAWRSMRRGASVEPWLAFALLVFAMTTLWSVTYLYYDVWLLLACALLVHDGSWCVLSPRKPGRAITLTFATAAVVVMTAASITPGAAFKIDIGTPEAAGYTGGGFGKDVPAIDDGRVVVWVEGATGRIRLPRASVTGGSIRIAIRPNTPPLWRRQTVVVALNGHPLGEASLKDGWQEITFSPKRRFWLYGFNVLDLSFAYASPREVSTTGAKEFAAAIDFVAVE